MSNSNELAKVAQFVTVNTSSNVISSNATFSVNNFVMSGAFSANSSNGSLGYVLTSNGASAPTWQALPATGVTISDDTTTNATRYPLFANQTSGNLSTEYTSSTKLKYNPSTGEQSSPIQVASNGIFVNNTTVATSYTIGSGTNGHSVGPMVIASGQSVTVSSGQRWLVL